MARLKLAKRKGQDEGRRGTVLAAIAGFAVLCGLLLVITAPDLRCGGKSRQEAAARSVLSALRAINQASRDLESGNFGNARIQVRSAQQALTGALTDLQGAPEEH